MCFFGFPFLGFSSCCRLFLVDPLAVLPRVSIHTLIELLGALCRMGSEGEADAASFRPTLRRSNATRSHRDAGLRQLNKAKPQVAWV
jgi:hypothetical protein